MVVMMDLDQGCLYSLDWTTGLDYWTGLLDCEMRGQRSSPTYVRMRINEARVI